jgi:hypothetical protein
MTIENDADQVENKSIFRCRIRKHADVEIEETTRKLSETFYEMFMNMKPLERQIFFLELLNMIEDLVTFYEKRIFPKIRGTMDQNALKGFRNDITS